jgi:NTE family protein
MVIMVAHMKEFPMLSSCLYRILKPVFLLVLICTPALQAAEIAREKVGLVLAGGGARGIAHVGVIRALEEMQIPVDAIAGTSMGALVGGLYATGITADDLQNIVAAMDWEAAFSDKVDRSDLPVRRKADDGLWLRT